MSVFIIICFVFQIVSISSLLTLNGISKYVEYLEMSEFLHNISQQFPNNAKLYSIGKSVQGRDLLVMEITADVNSSVAKIGVPNVKIVGAIHGNEPVGREIALRFIEYLVTENSKGNEYIKELLKSVRIHVLPIMNPDGFETTRKRKLKEECTFDPPGRKNARGVDLNRNFPDARSSKAQIQPLQPETEAVRNWMRSIPFVASISVHSGAIAVIYPYDYQTPDDGWSFVPSYVTSDEDVFRHLATTYASVHPRMQTWISCPDAPPTNFQSVTMNGASWYPIRGSMQDYNYLEEGCMEITVEASCCKYPPADKINTLWLENRQSLISWIREVQKGVKGIITDGVTGEPVYPAKLRIEGRNSTFKSSKHGEYWRILLSGIYTLKVYAENYREQELTFHISDTTELLWLNITLWPTRYTTDTEAHSSTITTTTNDNISRDLSEIFDTDLVEPNVVPVVSSSRNAVNDSFIINLLLLGLCLLNTF